MAGKGNAWTFMPEQREIFPEHVQIRADPDATALFLVHTLSRGSLLPSRFDIQITNRIAETWRLLGMVVHDRVIIEREGHVSLKAKGQI
jgi:DNA repair protein RadC